jgi:hypothetical protein
MLMIGSITLHEISKDASVPYCGRCLAIIKGEWRVVWPGWKQGRERRLWEFGRGALYGDVIEFDRVDRLFTLPDCTDAD